MKSSKNSYPIFLCLILLFFIPSCSSIIPPKSHDVVSTSGNNNLKSSPSSSEPSYSHLDLPEVSIADGSEFFLEWNPDHEAINYHFQLSQDKEFSSVIIDEYLDDPFFESEKKIDDGIYYWRVMANYLGQNGTWSPPVVVQSLTLDALESTSDSLLVYKRLPIEWLLQRKDTSMLCLEGLYEADVSNPWDSEHSSHDIHGDGYCVRSTLSMMVSYYGGNLSQDRISYELYKGGEPEGDLGHGIGPTKYSDVERVIEWALGLDIELIEGKPSFDQIMNWINNDQPIFAIFPNKSEGWRHASLINGFINFTPPKALKGDEYLIVLDPFEKQRWIEYDKYDIDAYVVGPSGQGGAPDVRMEEDDDWNNNGIADTVEDSDSDGIVDFDEIYRFGTNHLDIDTDHDGVPDKVEIRSYIFDNNGERLSVSWGPDFDEDGIRTELDPDSDGGGAPDGCEDTNFNGKYEPELGETSNFNATDDIPDSCFNPNEMILIPAGEFQMGCDPEHNGGYPCKTELYSNVPLHTVYLDAYLIDTYEVTNAQYAECVESGVCNPPLFMDYYENPEYANYPVIGIEFASAETFCSWAGKRLPTEAEWEKAARGESPRAYPWGDQAPNCNLANYSKNYEESCKPDIGYYGSPAPVGSYPEGVSPYGVHDMAGNVFEWVSDYYSNTYYGWSPYENPQGPTENEAFKFSWLACPTCTWVEHVLRGGASKLPAEVITTATRYIQSQGPFEYFGIRCAADADFDPNLTPQTPGSSCPGAPPQRLAIGKFGEVCTKSDSIRLRKTPGKNGEVVASLNPGTTFEVIEGPECAGSNWSWWKVRLDNDLEGWLAEGGDEIDPYFLCPIP